MYTTDCQIHTNQWLWDFSVGVVERGGYSSLLLGPLWWGRGAVVAGGVGLGPWFNIFAPRAREERRWSETNAQKGPLPAWGTYFFICPYEQEQLWNVKKYVSQVGENTHNPKSHRALNIMTPDLRKGLNTVCMLAVCVHLFFVCVLLLNVCVCVCVFFCAPVCVYLCEYLHRWHTQFSAPFWFGWVQSASYCRDAYGGAENQSQHFSSGLNILRCSLSHLFLSLWNETEVSVILRWNTSLYIFPVLAPFDFFLATSKKKKTGMRNLICVLGDGDAHRQQFAVNGAVNKCLLIDTYRDLQQQYLTLSSDWYSSCNTKWLTVWWLRVVTEVCLAVSNCTVLGLVIRPCLDGQ